MRGPIAQGTIRTTFVLGLRLAVQAGTLLIVARLLGPDRFGAFAGVASLAVMLGTLSTFGTHLVLLGRVSRDPAERESVLLYAVPTTLLGGGILLALYLMITTLALGELGIAWPTLVALGVTEIWLQPLLGLPVNEHLGLGRIARSQLLATLPLLLRLTAAVATSLLPTTDQLSTFAYGYFCASVVALVFASVSMPVPWPRPRTWRLPNRFEFSEAAGFAAIGLTAMSPAELDKTLATRMLPLGVAGMYAAGSRIVGATTLPVIAMLLSALPRLFREGQALPERSSYLSGRIFGAALAYSGTLALVLWTFAPSLDLVFGKMYSGLGDMIRWLCLAVPGMALRLAAGSILMAQEKPWMRVGFEAGGMGILVLATVALTYKFGSIGMPLALACSEWGMTVIGFFCIYRAKSPTKHSVA